METPDLLNQTIKKKRIWLFDTTLRDGNQTVGVDFSVADKVILANAIDAFGLDYVETGWPGANATEDLFFQTPPAFQNAKLVAFGMTRRHNHSAGNDPGLAILVNNPAPVICIVGKSWDFQVSDALRIPLEENLSMISDSVRHLKAHKEEIIFDAEHFFDGYKNNPDYTLRCLKAAHDEGARWIVLCDTNGGTLPDEIEHIVKAVSKDIPISSLGIHTHNDTGNAVANSLAAIRQGIRHVQGTLNGIGERCGNANLVSLIPTLMLKMGFESRIEPKNLPQLTALSRLLDDRLNRSPDITAPYVGSSAFAHKAGLHASGVARNPATYEHISPDTVGNTRFVSMSSQGGRASLMLQLRNYGLGDETFDDKDTKKLLDTIKEYEKKGYSYEGAEASLELLMQRTVYGLSDYYQIKRFRVIDENRHNQAGQQIMESEATVILDDNGEQTIKLAFAHKGPVNALDNALRQALLELWPELEKMKLIDYKVRIIPLSGKLGGTNAVTRVTIESGDETGKRWSTIGVSPSIIAASMEALSEAYHYFLFSHAKKQAKKKSSLLDS